METPKNQERVASIQWRLKSQWEFAPESDLAWTHYQYCAVDRAEVTAMRLNAGDRTFEYRVIGV